MRFLVVFLVAVISVPATANNVAVYNLPNNEKMTIKIADNGWARLIHRPEQEGVVSPDDEIFWIENTVDGSVVIRHEDMIEGMKQQWKLQMKNLGIETPKQTEGLKISTVKIEKYGEFRNSEWAGQAFTLTQNNGVPQQLFVVSNDPKLAPFGRLFRLGYYESIKALQSVSGMPLPDWVKAMGEVLEKGAPTLITGMAELKEVKQVAIDDADVMLPMQPLKRREAIRYILSKETNKGIADETP